MGSLRVTPSPLAESCVNAEDCGNRYKRAKELQLNTLQRSPVLCALKKITPRPLTSKFCPYLPSRWQETTTQETKMSTKRDIRQEVTDTIIEALESGTAPWVKGWSGGAAMDMPRNGATGRQYNGVNVLLLWISAHANGYGSNEWMTYKQTQGIGGQVRKGEKSTMVTFWKIVEKKDDAGEIIDRFFFLKHFNVFNRDQIDGLPVVEAPEVELTEAERHERTDALIEATGASISWGDARAAYSPASDSIRMPAIEQFDHEEQFYSTALHELTHWTGHKSRLGRELSTGFGGEQYAREELIAELGSAFVCAELGIDGRLQHAEYIGSWIKILKEDKGAIITAASKARKAADFLMAFEAQEVDVLEAA